MEKKLENYIIKTAYNYLTGYTDIEICDKFGEYRGTLNGSRYDFDDITDDDIEYALANDDYDVVCHKAYRKHGCPYYHLNWGIYNILRQAHK